MKKNNIYILLTVVAIMLFALGCGATTQAENSKSPMFSMQLMGYDSVSDFKYYRDTTTDVLYLWRYSGTGGGLTTMMDPETGLPLTYMRYLEIYESGSNDAVNEAQK